MKPTIVFDTETTGKLNYSAPIGDDSQPHIVQLGAQLFDEQDSLKGELNLLVKPEGWEIPAEATAIHGITTEECAKFGIPIRSALGLFNLWLQFGVVLVAHNIDFDVSMVETETARLGRDPILNTIEKYCTMKNSENIVKIPSPKKKGYKWPTLQEAHKHLFGNEFEGAHDAMADVRACARVYFIIRKP